VSSDVTAGRAAPPRPPLVDVHLHHDIAAWLVWEAELLDGRRFRDWLALVADDVRYRLPVRVTLARRDEGRALATAMDHLDEDRYSLEKRVERLDGEHAWTEDPPSRTRRFVSNVRVTDVEGDEVEARSYLLLYRSRGDDRAAELLAAERTDRLRRDGGSWLLVRRDVVVDDAVLRTQNLALFL
jgi:phthalate 3,4-dioxygenase beta subunit